MMTDEDKFRDSTENSREDQPTTNARDDQPRDDEEPTGPASAPTTNYAAGDESFVLTVIHLLADTLDEDPMTMHPRLGEVIDPDILIRLQQSDNNHEQAFTFTYRDCTVTVTSHGTVSVSQNSPHGAS